MPPTEPQLENPWPHRLAVALAVATFPLIWVGGLVTTYDAGMAVPDWPTTYGYNMFLYPWQTWVYGPWDLFIEHGHRLFAASVGLLTILLVVVLWRCERRIWVRQLGLAALAGVIFQGVLGGMRVHFDARLLAQIHGCVGPAFFALTVALAVFTSRRCRQEPSAGARAQGRLARLALITTGLVYLQIVIGSQLRHVPVEFDAGAFRATVLLHLFLAAAVLVQAVLLVVRVCRQRPGERWLLRPAGALVLLMASQVALGCATWVVNYGWPAWLSGYVWAAQYVVRRESATQSLVTTAHVAVGSLVLVTALVAALRSLRLTSAPWPHSEAAL